MDLPTYTSIWRIEKRLYKLYDFRLPIPLPIGQMAVFAAIAVPYVVLLVLLGLPFGHTLIWLYILPPGVLTWLATRPVLESKRLPELVMSHLRYLAEPRVWCRMAPTSERDVIVVTARIWRPARATQRSDRAVARPAPPAGLSPAPLVRAAPPVTRPAVLPVTRAAVAPVTRAAAPPVTRPAAPGRPAASTPPATPPEVPARPAETPSDRTASRPPDRAPAITPAGPRPAVTFVGAAAKSAPPLVERALAGPSARRGDVRAGRVTVVPGGHRPGRPDQIHRDRARAQLPLGAAGRIVVLGCTVGAGQTSTALLAGEVLASLRSGEIAVLDLNPGAASLAHRALARPALSQAASLGPSRLTVLDAALGADSDPAQDVQTLELAAERYEIVLADPCTAAVPRLLAITDQLVLVAPASAAAASAIAMTFEWLEAHGQGSLAADSIMVVNGVSRASLPHVEQAERVCAGRCRAIVRVPWDDQLNSQGGKRAHPSAPGTAQAQQWAGLLTPATAGAYTALAGVLVTGLAERAAPDEPELEPAYPGQARR